MLEITFHMIKKIRLGLVKRMNEKNKEESNEKTSEKGVIMKKTFITSAVSLILASQVSGAAAPIIAYAEENPASEETVAVPEESANPTMETSEEAENQFSSEEIVPLPEVSIPDIENDAFLEETEEDSDLVISRSGVTQVRTWQQFRKAWNTDSVTEIVLTENISAAAHVLNTRTRNIRISSSEGSFQLNMGGTHRLVLQNADLRISGVQINGTNSAHLIDSDKGVEVQSVFNITGISNTGSGSAIHAAQVNIMSMIYGRVNINSSMGDAITLNSLPANSLTLTNSETASFTISGGNNYRAIAGNTNALGHFTLNDVAFVYRSNAPSRRTWNSLSANLSGQNMQNIANSSSDPNDFAQHYDGLQNVRLISAGRGEGWVNPPAIPDSIRPTTINSVDSEATTVTGTAEPNASVEVSVNGITIGRNVVNSAGNYSVTIPKQSVGTVITATASLNNVTSSAATVVRQASIRDTTINNLNTDSTVATGTAEPNATIEIKANNVVLGSGRVGSDGQYAITIPKQSAGTSVSAQATLNGVTSNTATTTVERAGIDETTLDDLTDESIHATGSAEPNATIEIKANNIVLGSGRVGSDGKYMITIPRQTAGTIVTAQAVLNGVESNIASTTVEGVYVSQGTIQPNDYRLGQESITGSFTGDVSTIKLEINDTEINGNSVLANGNFTFNLLQGTRIQLEDKVVLKAYDEQGKLLDEKNINVLGREGSITPNVFRTGQTTVTGSFTGDVYKVDLYINGERETVGSVLTGNEFSIYVGSEKLRVTDEVILKAYDVDGNQLDEKQVTVAPAEGRIIPAAYTVGDSYIRGTYEGNVERARVFVNGHYAGQGGTYNADGTFEFWINPALISAGDEVIIRAYDLGYITEISSAVVEVLATEGTLQPNAYTLGDSFITGTYTGDIQSSRLMINDQVAIAAGGDFHADGTFSVWVGNQNIKNGDNVVLQGFDRNPTQLGAVELDRQQVAINNNVSGTITPNTYNIGDTFITGTYTGDVASARLLIDGTIRVPAGGTFNADGTFNYWVGNQGIQANQEVRMVAFDRNPSDSQAVELDNQLVPINQQSTGKMVTAEYMVGENFITGTFEGDIVTARLWINGEQKHSGGDFNDGKFTFFVGPNLINAGDEVLLKGFDRNGKELDSISITVQKLPEGSLSPDVYRVGDSFITGTYTGDIATARILVNGQMRSIGGTFNADGTFNYWVGSLQITAADTVVLEAFDRTPTASGANLLDSKKITIQ